MPIRLPARPGRYGFGPDMPAGHIDVQQLAGSSEFTVTRVVDGETWVPLDAQDNPAWLMWPSAMEAGAWVNEVAPVKDWPHWGAAPAR